MGACASRGALPQSSIQIMKKKIDDGHGPARRVNENGGTHGDSLVTIESKTEQESTIPDEFRQENAAVYYRLNQKNVYDFIWQYMEDITEVAQNPSEKAWANFWDKNHTKDYILIRPSGNPLDLKGAIAMFETGDITNFSDAMVAVESLKILGDGLVATMVFKSEQLFNYKGSQEDDLVTWTAVLVADQDLQQPKITNIHRSPGKRVGSVFCGNSDSPSKEKSDH
uniref:Uncharacterized protein n=1 Tax=Amphora coffeiformis TaxID=265554 RepID=A0A7S3P8C0_9STRA|mmetsp:Transcript_10323/g.19812  ORF Transcript_10323/g.19812 Transcript_10323/m.19812 type:complete len:225 (+) Transcript_10323:266-940(+)|eukprot:scaffold83_cov181-Amphora_coffeaeformis.AAC.32